ncbi:hypothetical protein L0222_31325, partial [bacterium]|nr:hypothetical protein [bacterium]
RGTAVCAFFSALTTLGVHLLPLLHPAPTFEEQLLLANNSVYIFRLWVVLIHILFGAGFNVGRRGCQIFNYCGSDRFGDGWLLDFWIG